MGIKKVESHSKAEVFPGLIRNPLRAKKGRNITQLHYARKGNHYPRNGIYCD